MFNFKIRDTHATQQMCLANDQSIDQLINHQSLLFHCKLIFNALVIAPSTNPSSLEATKKTKHPITPQPPSHATISLLPTRTAIALASRQTHALSPAHLQAAAAQRR